MSTQAERIRELTALAAQRAAESMGQLAGCRLRVGETRHGRALSLASGPWETGLFVEVEGALRGVTGLIFGPGARGILAKMLLRDDADSEDAVESALRELGNIVASQALSAMADAVGGRLLPSVPILASRGGDAALLSLIRRRGGASGDERCECLLEDRSSGLRMLLVFAPDPEGASPPGV